MNDFPYNEKFLNISCNDVKFCLSEEKCSSNTDAIQSHADFVLSFFANAFNVCYFFFENVLEI